MFYYNITCEKFIIIVSAGMWDNEFIYPSLMKKRM